ncbi:hypothetical protein [Actinoplanes nipponensis]|uniref:hypothetical protein n=1 Tax=Actinoplanes nipponensis TaxID=135950 RepID=UPI0031EEC8CB
MVLRFWAWPRSGPESPGGGLPAPLEAVGSGTPTGPVEAGGRNGASIAPGRPSSSSPVPAVMAARVGSDASPTSRATMST